MARGILNRYKEPKAVQLWVGHADLSTTLDIYYKAKDKESKKDISSSLDELLLIDE